MKKQAIMYFFITVCTVLCAMPTPSWITEPEKDFPPQSYIRSISEGNTLESAKKNALSELSAYFSQTVKAEVNAVQTMSLSENVSKNEQIIKSISTSSITNLFLVHYTEAFFDKSKKSYTVCAYIKKDEAWEVLSQKLSILQVSFENGFSMAQKEKDPLKKLIALNSVLARKEDFYSTYNMALAVYPQKCTTYTSLAKSIENEKLSITRLKQEVKISVSVAGDFSNQIKTKISNILLQNGLTVSNNAPYMLNVLVSAKITETNGIYTCTPQIEGDISGKSGTITSFAITEKKAAAYNAQTAERTTLFKLEKMLDESFIDNCFQ